MRTVLLALETPKEADRHETAVVIALAKMKDTSQLLRLLANGGSATETEAEFMAHKVCLTYRPTSNITAQSSLKMISPDIQKRLLVLYRGLTLEEKWSLYRTLAPFTSTRRLAGIIFEELCLETFCLEGISLEYMPMIRLSAKTGVKKQPSYHSSHRPLNHRTLEQLRLQQNSSFLSIPATSMHSRLYLPAELTSELEPDEGVYYIPDAPNQETMDSFIVYQGSLYVFQFTIAQSHDTKMGIAPFIERMKKSVPVIFIYIIPHDLNLLKVPYQAKPPFETIPCYSAQIIVDASKVGDKSKVDVFFLIILFRNECTQEAW